MAFASVSKETGTLGVKITEGEGSLPKVVLNSPHGRQVLRYSNSFNVVVIALFVV